MSSKQITIAANGRHLSTVDKQQSPVGNSNHQLMYSSVCAAVCNQHYIQRMYSSACEQQRIYCSIYAAQIQQRTYCSTVTAAAYICQHIDFSICTSSIHSSIYVAPHCCGAVFHGAPRSQSWQCAAPSPTLQLTDSHTSQAQDGSSASDLPIDWWNQLKCTRTVSCHPPLSAHWSHGRHHNHL